MTKIELGWNSQEALDIYNMKQQVKNFEPKLLRSNITDANKETILKLIKRRTNDGLTPGRIRQYYRTFIWVAERIKKNLVVLTLEDVREIVHLINNKCRSEYTRVEMLCTFKKGMQIIKGYPKPESPHIRYPQELAWISTSPDRRKISRPSWDDLVQEKELYKDVIRFACNSRDKLLLVMLRESGARIGSIATARIGDLVFRNQGFVLRAKRDKTGPIDIPFYIATPYLNDWLNDHPHGDNKRAPLFVCLTRHRGQLLTYSGIQDAIRSICKRSGFTKKLNPHHLRHSDATILGLYMPTSLMEKRYNWSSGSPMPSYYQHVSGKQVDIAMRKLRGLEADELPRPMKAPLCKKCNIIAYIHSMRCPHCGQIVKIEEMDEERKKQEPVKVSEDAVRTLAKLLTQVMQKHEVE